MLSADRLGELGETAIIEVARGLIGNIGAMVALFAGLLATLSSANASILSASRTLFALSNDQLVPHWLSSVHERFGTPHRAIILVGLPIVGVLFVGNLEVLAETASLLHLIIYGLICACVLKLRKQRPIWYVPGFKTPAYPLLPAVGMVASFGLIFFMKPLSMMLGGSVFLLSALFFVAYGRGKKLSNPSPPHIEPELRTPRILLPVSLPQEQSISLGIVKGFTDLEIFLLGYKEVPEQMSPRHSEEKEGEKARAELQKVKEELEEETFEVKTELVFTSDVSQAIDNAILEYDCQAILVDHPIGKLDRLLIPIYDINQLSKRLATVIYELSRSSNLPATLLFLGGDEDDKSEEDKKNTDISAMKRKARRLLNRAGVKNRQIDSSIVPVENISEAVKEQTTSEDLVILVEASASERKSFINTIRNEISEKVEGPLLVVLEKRKEDDRVQNDSAAEEIEEKDT